MNKVASSKSEFQPDAQGLLADVAELYYKDGLTQNEIAQRLGVSRPTIVNYIKQAREQGIVDIQIRGSSYTGSNLSRRLRDKHMLQDVYIARTAFETDALARANKVARLAASALSDLLTENDVLGVSWGSTIQLAADEMPHREIKGLSVCQLVGSMTSDAVLAAEASTIRIANRTGASCNTLPVPAVVSSVKLAQQLRNEPIVQKHLEQFNQLTKAFFSVGDLTDESLVYSSGMASKSEWESYRQRSAHAVLVGRFLDNKGDALDGDFAERLMGIQLEQLLSIPMRMLVASGLEKKDAVLATLAGGYATHLVIDEGLAEHL